MNRRTKQAAILGRNVNWFRHDDDSAAFVPQVTRLWPSETWGGWAAGDNAQDSLWDSPAPDWPRVLLDTQRRPGAESGFGEPGLGVANSDVLLSTYITPPLRGAQRIAGMFRMTYVVYEDNAGADYGAQIVIKVVDTNGVTVRGTLYAGYTGSLVAEFDINPFTRHFPPDPAGGGVILSPVNAQDGDRVLVEVGFRQYGTSTVDGNAIIDETASDDAPFDGGHFFVRPWAEFSQLLTFREELEPSWMYDGHTPLWTPTHWHTPELDLSAQPVLPPVSPFDPATGDWSWDGSRDLWLPTRWRPPDESADVFVPPPTTRLWFSPASPWTIPLPSAEWESSAVTADRWMVLQPDKSAAPGFGGANRGGTGTSGDDVHLGTAVSRPLNGAQTISGTFHGIARFQETSATDDYRTQIVIYVTDTNGATVRGVLYAGDTSGLLEELVDGTYTGANLPQAGAPTALTPVNALDGDRIVVELGFRAHSTSTNGGLLRITDPSGTDLSFGDAANGAAWIDFTCALTFRDELAPDWMYDHQPFVSNAQRWYQPDVDSVDYPTVPPEPPFDTTVIDFGWDAALDQWHTEWLFADVLLGVNSNVEWDSSLIDYAWDAQQDRWTWPTWFAPEASIEGDIPRPGTPPAFDTSVIDFGWDAALDRSNAQRWVHPDDDTLGYPPFVPPLTADQLAGLWQDSSPQQDRSLQPVWFQPADATEPIYPYIPVVPFTPDEAPLGEQPQVWNPVWFSPDVFESHQSGPLQDWLFIDWGLPGGYQPVLIDATSGDTYLGIGGPFIVPAK